MDPHAGGELPPQLHPPLTRWQLTRRRRRCARTARVMLAGAAVGLAALGAVGLRPAAVAIPLFLASMSLLMGAASAALFARVARLELGGGLGGEDDEGGFGRGLDVPEQGPGGDGPTVDWERFEREFRAYCARSAVHPR